MSTFQQRNARYKRLHTTDINNGQKSSKFDKKFEEYSEEEAEPDDDNVGEEQQYVNEKEEDKEREQKQQRRHSHSNNYNRRLFTHHDIINNNNNNNNNIDDNDDNHNYDDAHEEIELHRSELHVDGDGHVTDDYYVVGGGKRTIGPQGIEAGNIEYYATKKFMQKTIWTLAVILFYLTLSICLTFYQNRLLKSLQFPLCIVTYHMIFKLFMAGCVRSAWKYYVGEDRVLLDWRSNLKKMAPTGIASGIDIGFSMWGLELVSISLYTMTKSTTIIYIMIFSLILGLEKKSWSLVVIVGLISGGLFMFTYKSTNFNLLGFILLLIASMSSGVRWTLAQFIIQKSQLGLHNPIDMIFHMQPWMIATLIPMSLIFEGKRLVQVILDLGLYSPWDVLSVVFRVSFGAILAFFMECSEFMVLSKTSSLTLSIAGIFKEICQLALAVEFYGDQLKLMNFIGMVMCLLGICSHLLHKFMILRHLNAMQLLENNDDSTWNRDGINHDNYASGSVVGMTSTVGKHSAQSVPLLDEITDSYDSDNDDEPNASDVIYDVLKRRDMQR